MKRTPNRINGSVFFLVEKDAASLRLVGFKMVLDKTDDTSCRFRS